MEPVTTYTGSDGKTQPISEMNNFHLVNAYTKMVTHPSQEEVEGIKKALKDEIFKRMDNRPQQA